MCAGKDDTDDDDDKGAEDKGARCEYVLEGVNMDANMDVGARTHEHELLLQDQGPNRFVMANIASAMEGKGGKGGEGGDEPEGEISQEIISLSPYDNNSLTPKSIQALEPLGESSLSVTLLHLEICL